MDQFNPKEPAFARLEGGTMFPLMAVLPMLRFTRAIAIVLFLTTGNLWTERLQGKNAPPAPPANVQGCPATPAQEGATLPEGGRIQENVYTNNFYGLRYEFPSGWYVDEEAIQSEAEKKKHLGNPPNLEDKARYAIWREIQCHHLLLKVSRDPKRHPDERPGVSHAGILSISLNINDLAIKEEVKTPQDSSNAVSVSPDEPFQIVGGPTDYKFDGQLFSRTDWRVTLAPALNPTAGTLSPGRITYRSNVSGVRNDRMILFVIYAEDPQQIEDLFQTLYSLRFK